MKAFLTTAALVLIAAPAFAETPVFPGAAGTDCDPAQFTPIFGENGNVLYWNNPTCPNGQGGMDAGHSAFDAANAVPVVEEDEPVEEELPAEA